MLLLSGRWNSHYRWQVLLPSGRWNSHYRVGDWQLVDVITYGVQVHLKGGVTIKNLLVAPKDQDPMLKKSGVIYRCKCDRVDCDDEYI